MFVKYNFGSKDRLNGNRLVMERVNDVKLMLVLFERLKDSLRVICADSEAIFLGKSKFGGTQT